MPSLVYHWVRDEGSFPYPVKCGHIEGGAGSWSLVSAAGRAADRSWNQGCLHIPFASSLWMLLVGRLQRFHSLAVHWLLQEANFSTGPSHSSWRACSSPGWAKLKPLSLWSLPYTFNLSLSAFWTSGTRNTWSLCVFRPEPVPWSGGRSVYSISPRLAFPPFLLCWL